MPQHLKSLDALRGFDMFCITGDSKLVHMLAAAAGWSWLQGMNKQLSHSDWNGFRAYDLILPLFIFMAGHPRLSRWTVSLGEAYLREVLLVKRLNAA